MQFLRGLMETKGLFFFFFLPQNGKQYLLLYSLSMDNRTIFHSFNFLIYYLFFWHYLDDVSIFIKLIF